jgi:hypothetical protein
MAHYHLHHLTDQVEKSIVCYGNSLDDYSHPVNIEIGKGFGKSLVHVTKCREVGKYFTTLLLNHHPELAARFCQCLDHQAANESYPAIIIYFFAR